MLQCRKVLFTNLPLHPMIKILPSLEMAVVDSVVNNSMPSVTLAILTWRYPQVSPNPFQFIIIQMSFFIIQAPQQMNIWTEFQALQQDTVIIIAAHSSSGLWVLIKERKRSIKIKPSTKVFGENIFIMGEEKNLIASNYYEKLF